MKKIEQPTLSELVSKRVQYLKEQGHGHNDRLGRTQVIGDSSCYVCKPIIDLASIAQEAALHRTHINNLNPEIQPCEVCGSNHKTYECCDRCSFDTHTCPACGEPLGHSEVSSCYLLNIDITDAD